MKKSRAVISLLLVAAISGLMAYTVLIGFGKGHRGSYHNIKKGLDLAGGASITYQAVGEEPPSQEDLNDTKYKLQRRVDQYSTEAQVYTEGTDRLNIEIPGISELEVFGTYSMEISVHTPSSQEPDVETAADSNQLQQP